MVVTLTPALSRKREREKKRWPNTPRPLAGEGGARGANALWEALAAKRTKGGLTRQAGAGVMRAS